MIFSEARQPLFGTVALKPSDMCDQYVIVDPHEAAAHPDCDGAAPQEEIILADRAKDGAAAARNQAQRAEDAKKAMSDYEAEAAAVAAKTARLKAARLAKEAE